MPSRFEQRYQARSIPKLNRSFGVPIRFQRGINLSAEFTARRSSRNYTAIGAEYGIEIKITMRDFVLPVDSVVIAGDTLDPRTGDRIIEGDEVFEIQPIDQNKPSVELQSGGYEWLVHTKKVE